uniref:NBPF n=1 Tax=Echinostoma caproni TaxID=27848 RepID=A0A183A1J6_9TREM
LAPDSPTSSPPGPLEPVGESDEYTDSSCDEPVGKSSQNRTKDGVGSSDPVQRAEASQSLFTPSDSEIEAHAFSDYNDEFTDVL